jgi:type IV fimbrial biogenesis protein FimT
MKQGGVTLVELLSVLAIGVILLAIGVPSYGYLINNSRLVGLSNGLVRALNLARSEAIKRNAQVTVCTTSLANSATPACDAAAEWNQGWLVFVDQGIIGVVDGTDQVIAARAYPAMGATATTSNFSYYVSYHPSGLSQGPNNLPNGSINFCLAGEEHSVILNIAGRIRTSEASC